MKKLLTVLGFLMLCSPAFGQFSQLTTPRQVCPNTGSACAFAASVVSGNLEFVMAHSEGALTTPTGTQSGSFSLIDSHTGGANAYMWCRVLTSSGSETITLNGSVSFGGQVSIEIPASYGLTCTKDASANGATASGTVTTSNITTTANGDFMLCYMSNFHSGGTPMPQLGNGWMGLATQNGSDGSGAAFKWAGTNGAQNCIFTGGTDTSAGYVIAAFKPSAATFVTAALPSAALSNTYDFTLQCVGGAGAYTWSVSSGSLPTGLSLNSSTGEITGTPTGGTQTPTFKCDDGTHNATAALLLTVNSSAGTASVATSTNVNTATNPSLGTVTSGNCILVVGQLGQNNGNAAFSLPVDGLSTPYTYIGTISRTPAGGILQNPLWIGQATSSGSDTFTGSTNINLAAVQFSSTQCFADAVKLTNGNNSGSVTISGPSVTTLAPGSEVWGDVSAFTSSTTWTAGTGFTVDAVSTGSSPMQAVHANESTVGSYTPSFAQTGNSDGTWNAWSVALRPSTSGVVSSGAMRHKSQVF